MSDDSLLVAREEQWGVLTLNRPHVGNAADQALWQRIAQEAARLAADPQVRVIIVTGTGERAFMAGADLNEFPTLLQSPQRARDYVETVAAALDTLEELEVPVIAQINGSAIGGGLELAIACDYRVAVEGARFGIPAADVGLAINYCDVERLVELVGSARAREVLLLGRVYTAQEALAIGLVNEVVPREQLAPRVRELARELAAKAPASLRSAKKVLRAVTHRHHLPREEALRSIQEAWDSQELKERVQRLLGRLAGGARSDQEGRGR